MPSSPRVELLTLGHATMVILEDGRPLLATDPWLIGSAYWRGWWLDRYPTPEEMELVAKAGQIYITHGHPDHFHPPTLRHLAWPSTLHPDFVNYPIPDLLRTWGSPAQSLEACRWYSLSADIKIASVPVLTEDSILLVDTPTAMVVNLNDCAPPASLLKTIKRLYLDPDKPVVVLKSHSPASPGAAMYRDGQRVPISTTDDYCRRALEAATALGASHLISFGSQACFGRTDSKWANDFRVTWEDVRDSQPQIPVEVCPPHVLMDLATLQYATSYTGPSTTLDERDREKVATREREEAAFHLPSDFAERLANYLSGVWGLRLLLRRGIGWRLTSSRTEWRYDVKTRKVTQDFAPPPPVVITVPDEVLYEAVQYGTITDLGNSMLIRTDSEVDVRRPYLFFALTALRDYGHFNGARRLWQFSWFNLRFSAPSLFPGWWRRQARKPVGELAERTRG